MPKTICVILITIPLVMHCANNTFPGGKDDKLTKRRVNKEVCLNLKLPKCDNQCLLRRLYNLKQWKRQKRRCNVHEKAMTSRGRRHEIEIDKEVFEENPEEDISTSPAMLVSKLEQRLDNLAQWKRQRMQYEKPFTRGRRRAIELDAEVFEETSEDVSTRLQGPLPTSSLMLISRFKQQWPVAQWRQYGLFTDEYLLIINSYWLQFPPPPPGAQYALGSLYIVVMAVGCSGNVLVLLMYFRCRSLRTPGNILVANLAFSDFLMLAKTPVFIFNSFNLGPALGKTGCVIYGFVGGLTGVTSIATLAAIALDRYWAVARPLEGLGTLTRLRARLLAVATWVYAAAFALVPALDLGYGHYVPEGYLTSCSFDYLTDDPRPRYFIFVFFCAAWLAPFCTITFCYLNIFRVVACNRSVATKNQEHRLSSRHVKEQVKRKAEIKLAFLVIVVIALFFVSWTPYAVVALLGIFGRKDLITPLSSMAPALFCKTAACINPFIYLITHPKFRKELKKLFYSDTLKSGGGTMKTIGYTTEGNRALTPSKDLSDTDEVEVVEMKNIPYQQGYEVNQSPGKHTEVQTISSRVFEREGSQRSASMKSLEESVVSPPSWYSKPQFSKKRSFHRRSIKSIISVNADNTSNI